LNLAGQIARQSQQSPDRTEPGPQPGDPSHTLRWHLPEQIARSMGATLKAAPHDRGARLQLEFARTVRHLQGLTALEIETNSADSMLNPETKAVAGLRVLLVSDDPAVCADVEKACRALGHDPRR